MMELSVARFEQGDIAVGQGANCSGTGAELVARVISSEATVSEL